MSNRIMDVSVQLIPGMPTWPGDGTVAAEPASRIANGGHSNVTNLRHTSHTGTHLDAPWHFIDSGKKLDTILLDRLIGQCLVCDFSALDRNIDAADLDAADIPDGTTRLLLRTKNSSLWEEPRHAFNTEFIGVNPSGAQWLVDHGVDLVGIDYLSIEPFDGDDQTHLILLSAELVIVEGLDLRQVDPGTYRLICLPLRLGEMDGAPCRVVLERESAIK
ncbi:MAG: cyclase family protein [Nitrolancea sp.]